ncbi:SKA complex subunit 1-like isoform X1 [Athene noctua]|uniref:SKA complex subunit 1-like isoform X1 n=1 Tax=Athene noctua TaxID=126797 RepID=UPI003EBD31EA
MRMAEMVSSGLEDLSLHINTKISNVKRTLQLRNAGEEPSFKSTLGEIKHEILLVNDLLNKMEMEVKHHKELKDLLKELQKSAESHEMEARHLSENIPFCLLKPTQSCAAGLTVKREEQPEVVEPKPAKKPPKESRLIKEASLITAEEFESLPAYMKGRLTCDQINAVVKGINKAVADKYKILHQPLKSMKAAARKLYYRFLEDETADSKGTFFVVEADIGEFTQLKVDKRFHAIVTVLRHCHRVREIRGVGRVRYVIS